MKSVSIILTILFFSACGEVPKDRLAELEAQVNALVEKDKIVETVNRLFIMTDSRDWEGVKSCFTEKVLLDMSSMTGNEAATVTAQQIVDSWDQGFKGLKAIHHQSGNHLVTLNEKEAMVFCYGIAFHYLPNESNQNTRIFVGSYDFDFINEQGKWKITKFKYNLKYIDGNLNLEKYVAEDKSEEQ